MPSPTLERLRGVWGSTPDDAHAVGEKGVALRFDGRRWYRVETPTDRELRAIFGLGPTQVYAVGEGGLVLRFDGTRWETLPSSAKSLLLFLDAGDGGSLLAVGANRTLLQLVP
jgi:hypothetical protein